MNVLIALHWGPHAFHEAALSWFAKNPDARWATCSLTQAGFVRLISNPSFDPSAPTPPEALQLLKRSIESNRHHQFWSDTIPPTAISTKLQQRMRGHKQVNDAYLLAMARHHNGTLLTFDSRMQSLAPADSEEYESLVILRQ